jgi:hypothetical protein
VLSHLFDFMSEELACVLARRQFAGDLRQNVGVLALVLLWRWRRRIILRRGDWSGERNPLALRLDVRLIENKFSSFLKVFYYNFVCLLV